MGCHQARNSSGTKYKFESTAKFLSKPDKTKAALEYFRSILYTQGLTHWGKFKIVVQNLKKV